MPRKVELDGVATLTTSCPSLFSGTAVPAYDLESARREFTKQVSVAEKLEKRPHLADVIPIFKSLLQTPVLGSTPSSAPPERAEASATPTDQCLPYTFRKKKYSVVSRSHHSDSEGGTSLNQLHRQFSTIRSLSAL